MFRVVIVLTALLTWTGCRESIPVPADMVGTWVADDSRYAGRSIELTEHRILLGVGQGQAEKYFIDAVYRDRNDGRTLYTIVYRARYGDDSLMLYRKDGGIVLTSRPEVRWRKGEVKR